MCAARCLLPTQQGVIAMMWSPTSIIDAWNDVVDKYSDPRVNDWFLMGSVVPTLSIVLVYVFFVKVLGPKLMEKRKPYDLGNIMLAYNFIQIIISVILFTKALLAVSSEKFSFRCQPVDYSPNGLPTAWACYLYFLSKFTELADTVFFVLRKKNNQISTLHVAHHGIMPISVWFGVKFIAGGHGIVLGLFNTFVHIWMYLYYFLAALGPSVQPYLWWKKYLTWMQIIQFIVVLIHGLQVLFIECSYPKIGIWIINVHAMFFLLMFKDFYTKAYKSKTDKSEFNVADLEVDPHRQGIKQSDLWTQNYEHLVNKRRGNELKRD